LPPNVIWSSLAEKIDIKGDICVPLKYDKSGISVCYFGDLRSNSYTVLYGDSHSQAISEELNKAFINLEIKGVKVVIEGCNVVPEIMQNSRFGMDAADKCISQFQSMLSYIKMHNANVIVSSRWSFNLYPVEGHIDDMPSKNSEGGIENDVVYREYVSVINGKKSFSGADKKIALHHLLDSLLSVSNKLF